MRFAGIVFDFDGVVVDSEMLSNSVIAEALSAIGHPTTTEQAIERYIGRHWADTQAAIEAELGRPLPVDFKDRTAEAFTSRIGEVGAVAGVEAFLEATAGVPKAVASSSPRAWLAASLERLGLAHHFGERLFSAAEHVSRGKPHPDIYLHAAAELGIAPGALLAIEDTAPGVRAAVGAGMKVVGLCAGLHCGEGYGDRLQAAGAHHIARSYREVLEFIR